MSQPCPECDIYPERVGTDRPSCRLHAAAPDLLKSAKRLLLTHGCGLVITYEGEDNECADCRDMREAIAKAESRTA